MGKRGWAIHMARENRWLSNVLVAFIQQLVCSYVVDGPWDSYEASLTAACPRASHESSLLWSRLFALCIASMFDCCRSLCISPPFCDKLVPLCTTRGFRAGRLCLPIARNFHVCHWASHKNPVTAARPCASQESSMPSSRPCAPQRFELK